MATVTIPTDVSPNKPTYEPDGPVGVTRHQTTSDTEQLPTDDTEMAAMGCEGTKPTSAPDSPCCSTADTDLSSELGCVPLDGVITESMFNIEKELHQKSKEDEKRFQQESLSAWEKEQEEQRYKRLQHLLEKSSIYSNFLLQKMEEQQKEEKIRQERRAKKLKKKQEEEMKKAEGVAGEKENREIKDSCGSSVSKPVTRRSGRSKKQDSGSQDLSTSDSQKRHRHSLTDSPKLSCKDEDHVEGPGSPTRAAPCSRMAPKEHTRDVSENLGLGKRQGDGNMRHSGEQEKPSMSTQESSNSESWSETSDSSYRSGFTGQDISGVSQELSQDSEKSRLSSKLKRKSPRGQSKIAKNINERMTCPESSEVGQESSQGSEKSRLSSKLKRKSPRRQSKIAKNINERMTGPESSEVGQESSQGSEKSRLSSKLKRKSPRRQSKIAKNINERMTGPESSEVGQESSQGSEKSRLSSKLKRKSLRGRSKIAKNINERITGPESSEVGQESSQGSEKTMDKGVAKEALAAETQESLEVAHSSDKSSDGKQEDNKLDEGQYGKDLYPDLARLACSVNDDSQEPASCSQVDDRHKTPVSSPGTGSQELKEKTADSSTKPSHGRVRKRVREDYTIADYIDKSTLSPMKRKRENEEDQRTSQLADIGSTRNQESLDVGSSHEEVKPHEVTPTSAQAKHEEDFVDTYSRMINGERISDLQPELFTGGVLRKYQLEGIEWLKVLYENGVNGILGDEMGLGKTIQCIGLFAHIIKMGVPGPFLVVAPLSTLSNWISEFQRFSPSIKVLLYHGTPGERESLRRQIRKQFGDYKTHPVVVTSYEIVMIDRKHLSNHLWKYIIVDEGHRIKNLNCRLIRELKMYHSANRVLLTGTPLQNNLAELWSMLNFLLPEVFDDLKTFESWFDFSTLIKQGGDEAIVAKEREQHVVSMLHQILSPFLLRRLKSDVELKVPPKKEILVQAPLTTKQEELYKDLVDKTIMTKMKEKHMQPVEQTVELTESGRVKRKCRTNINYAVMGDIKNTEPVKEDGEEDIEAWMQEVMENAERCKMSNQKAPSINKLKDVELNIKTDHIMTQLRKACNHPYLLEYPLDPDTKEYRIDEELVSSSGKILVLERLLPALKKQNHKVLIFSQMTKMLDVLEDYCYLRKYTYCRLDGKMKMSDRQEQIDDFNNNPDIFLFLLSTRAGGLGINLTAADTVVIYDSDWNPQSDLQAQDRCHRIGQTKPVVIYRLTTSNTIDQKIVERAAAKRRLEKMVIHQGKFKGGKMNLAKDSQSLINPSELLELLRSSDHSGVVRNCSEKVISDADLALLLDRSDLLAKFEGKKIPVAKKTTMKLGKSNVHSNVFKILDEERENDSSELRIST